MRKNLIYVLLMLMFTAATYSETPRVIENFDVKFYHPEKFGLKDLVFEARIDGLLKRLNEKKSYGALSDLYFKIYWIYPGQYKIVVNGLPNGFFQLKTGLRELIKNRLDFVIPKVLTTRMRGYKLTESKNKKETIVVAKGSGFGGPSSEMKMTFANNGKLVKFEESGKGLANSSEIDMGVKSWSHNKWVINKMQVKQIEGVLEQDVIYKFEYVTEKGVGFPKRIEIETTTRNRIGDKKQKIKEKGGISFTNFEVNTKKAEKYILKNL